MIPTTPDWLTARAKISPKHPYLILPDGETITFGGLHDAVTETAQSLADTIQPGQQVGIMMHSTLDVIRQTFAVMRLGGVLVPINTRLTRAEINALLERSQTGLVLDADPSLNPSPHCGEGLSPFLHPEACEAKPGCAGDGDKNSQIHSLSALPDLATSQGELDIFSQPGSPPSLSTGKGAGGMGSTFAIIHTSGTSGQPKGAVLTYDNVFHSAMASAYRIGTLPHDRWLSVLPLYHVGGLSVLIRSVLYGTTVDLLPRFDAEQVNLKLTHEPITLVSLVPTMLYRLLEIKQQPWNPRLRLVLLGGAAPSLELVEQCIAQNIPLAATYGLTEAASQVATATPEQVIRKPGSVGKPLMFTEVRVVDENGQDIPAGDYGEVIVHGPTVMQGYLHQPEATARTLRDGWLYTGDIGYLDDDGDLWLVQRRSDLIVSGGENVYPAEVEAVLRQHPAVQEVVVIGVEDTEWGQRVAAVVQLMADHDTDAATLMQFARQHLAGYKQPREIHFVESLPQTASGKINRAAVKGMFT